MWCTINCIFVFAIVCLFVQNAQNSLFDWKNIQMYVWETQEVIAAVNIFSGGYTATMQASYVFIDNSRSNRRWCHSGQNVNDGCLASTIMTNQSCYLTLVHIQWQVWHIQSTVTFSVPSLQWTKFVDAVPFVCAEHWCNNNKNWRNKE